MFYLKQFASCSLRTTLGAVLNIGSQLLIFPVFVYLFGRTESSETFILIGLFLGIAIGQAQLFSDRAQKWALFFIGIFLLAFGIFLRSLIIESLATTWLRNLTGFLFFTGLTVMGRGVADGVYQSSITSFTAYGRINLFSVIIAIIWICFLPFIGLDGSYIGLSFMVFLYLLLSHLHPFFSNSSSVQPAQPLQLSFEKSDLTVVLQGAVSATFICCYFSTVNLYFHPIGYMYHVYLILALLCLSVYPALHRYWAEKMSQPKSFNILALGSKITVILFLFLFYSPVTNNWANFLKWVGVNSTGSWLYVLFILSFCSVLMIPYLAFSGIVPIAELERPGKNNLFFCSIGNILGLVLFGWIFTELDLSRKLIALLFMTALVCIMTDHRSKQSLVYVAMAFALLVWGPDQMDRQIILKGQALQRYFQISGFERRTAKNKLEIKILSKKANQVGYIAFRGPASARLGFGGYSVMMNQQNDMQKGLIAADLLKPNMKNILILGLGNHETLRTLQSQAQILGHADLHIDVVDNFLPFTDEKFLNAVANEAGLQWPLKNVSFHFDDAIHLLANQKENFYDMIIWNLTWPNYDSLSKIYTLDFIKLIAGALSPTGYFISNFFGDVENDCVLRSAFPFAMAYPVGKPHPFGFLVGAKSNLQTQLLQVPTSQEFNRSSCQGIRLPSFANPFMWRGLSRKTLKNIYGIDTNEFSNFLPRMKVNPTVSRKIRSHAFTQAIGSESSILIASIPLTGVDSAIGRKEIIPALELYFGEKTPSGRFPEENLSQFLPLDSLGNEEIFKKQNILFLNTKNNISLLSHVSLSNPFWQWLAPLAKAYSLPTLVNMEPISNQIQNFLQVRSIFPPLQPALRQVIRNLGQSQSRVAKITNLSISRNPFLINGRELVEETLIDQKFTIAEESLGEKPTLHVLLATSANEVIKYKSPYPDIATLILLGELPEKIETLVGLKNAMVIIPWDSSVKYANDVGLNSCEFSAEFLKKTGYLPSFRSSLAYVAAELRDKNRGIWSTAVSTVSGRFSFNEIGSRVGGSSLILAFDRQGRRTLYADGPLKFCPGRGAGISLLFKRPLGNVDILKPSK